MAKNESIQVGKIEEQQVYYDRVSGYVIVPLGGGNAMQLGAINALALGAALTQAAIKAWSREYSIVPWPVKSVKEGGE